MAEASAQAAFAARFTRAFDAAILVTVILWQAGAAGTAMLSYLDDYRSPGSAVALWAAQCLIITAGSVLLLRRKGGAGTIWLLAAADLATGIAMVANCPTGRLLQINWAWSTVGLIGVLLLMHRPLYELVTLLAANAGTVLVALVATGDLDRHFAAGALVLLYGSASTQLAIVYGAREFRFNGGVTAAAAAERWEMATRETVIAEVAAARQNRYQEAGRLIAPILRGLADGTADPADPVVQHRCATAEAMLRQLLAEHKDIPDPVLRLLQPGIDEALRRGLVIDMARVGEPPQMDEAIASALVEVPLTVLSRTRTSARVTVVSTGGEGVSVSVLTDSDAGFTHATSDGVDLTIDHDGDQLWVEARWARQ